MKIHRVASLPSKTGLKAGDLYNVKEAGSDTWELWKVDKNGEAWFVSGLTKEEAEKLDRLTPELIKKLEDLNPSENGIHIGATEPDNPDDLWIDTSNIMPATPEQSLQIQALMDELARQQEQLDRLNYMVDFNMDSGDFKNKAGTTQFAGATAVEPGSPEDPLYNPNNPDYLGNMTLAADDPERPEDGWPLDVGDGIDPELDPKDYTIKHFRIKRDLYKNFLPDTLMDGEMGYIKDRNLLYIGNDGKPKLLNGGGDGTGGGGDNISATHIDLKESDESTQFWRIKVIADKNGDPKLIMYDAAIDTAADQEIVGSAEQLKGLMISMIYAGGEDGIESMENPVSHSFVELLNTTNRSINLKGMSLQYAKAGTTWKVLPLRGIIPPQRAFTVRGARCAPEGLNTTLVEIGDDDFDQDWPDMKLPNTQVKVFLTIGTQAATEANPYAVGGTAGKLASGYVDLAGIGGVMVSQTIDGFETAYPNILNRNRAIYRIYANDYNQRPTSNSPKGDTNNNNADFNYIDYKINKWTDNSKTFKPMTTKMGKKDIYYDKNNWDETKPNMVTNGYGRDAHKTRTFNWVSVGVHDEFLQYRKQGVTAWTTVESIKDPASFYKRRTIKGFNGVWFTVHKQIITNLTAGIYEYQVGRPNTSYMSPMFTFEVTALSKTDPFGLVVTTDQQAWSWEEYEPWRISIEHIEKWENDKDPTYPATGTKKIDYYINTGDMTENGIRPNEWIDYYNAGKNILPNYAQMNVVGNNDLCPLPGQLVGKINPESFEYFYTYEHNPNNIPMYQGDTMKSVYSYDYGMVHWVVLNTNNYIEEQKAWFIKDMQEVHSRDVKPRWIVVKMHDACFNIITDTQPKRDTGFNQEGEVPEKRYSWSRLFEEWGVHLVISGHKHTYARSKPLLEKVVNNVVVPLEPIAQTLNSPSQGEVQVSEITGVVYLMCQATGSKLDSNRDVPATSIYWNAMYFPGVGGKSNPSQYYPTYLKLDFTTEKITHYSYQVKNVMPAKSYSYDCYNPISLPKERILIDTSDVVKKWKNITV